MCAKWCATVWCNGVLVMQLLAVSTAEIKTWKYDSDIGNPRNIEPASNAEGCAGLVFPKILPGLATLDSELQVSSVTLPSYGHLRLEQNASLIIDINDSKCIKVKPMPFRDWLNPRNWLTDGNPNRAVPHAEQTPCRQDTVVLRKSPAVAYPGLPIKVAQVKFGSSSIDNRQLQEILKSVYGYRLFQSGQGQTRTGVIEIDAHAQCYEHDGCACQSDYRSLTEFVCNAMNNDQSEIVDVQQCYDPIDIIGHCRPFCGAAITFEPSIHFSLDKFNAMLPNRTAIDLHVSKVVRNDGQVLIQVVITDSKTYSGNFMNSIQEIHETIKNCEQKLNMHNIALTYSGGTYQSEHATLAIVFGSLALVLAMFAAIFLMNTDTMRKYKPDLRSIKSPAKKLGRNFAQQFRFARFENRDEGQLSMAASLMSLDKRSFDNPLYGATTSKTETSAGMEEVDLHDRSSQEENEDEIEEKGSELLEKIDEVPEGMTGQGDSDDDSSSESEGGVDSGNVDKEILS